MAPTISVTSDAAILHRLIRPDQSNLPAAAARAILKIDFEQSDRDRMRALAQKARDGTLTPDEQVETDNYERVGHLLDILHSKARRSLKKPNGR